MRYVAACALCRRLIHEDVEGPEFPASVLYRCECRQTVWLWPEPVVEDVADECVVVNGGTA